MKNLLTVTEAHPARMKLSLAADLSIIGPDPIVKDIDEFRFTNGGLRIDNFLRNRREFGQWRAEVTSLCFGPRRMAQVR